MLYCFKATVKNAALKYLSKLRNVRKVQRISLKNEGPAFAIVQLHQMQVGGGIPCAVGMC